LTRVGAEGARVRHQRDLSFADIAASWDVSRPHGMTASSCSYRRDQPSGVRGHLLRGGLAAWRNIPPHLKPDACMRCSIRVC
jgi:hypothetical protein